jgi:hypothetical protein
VRRPNDYLERNPDAVALAKKLARYPVNGHCRSLRDVAAELEAQGHLSASGTRYSAKARLAHGRYLMIRLEITAAAYEALAALATRGLLEPLD